MQWKFGLLCDHFSPAANGKYSLIGIFDSAAAKRPDGPVGISPFFVVGHLECSALEGTEHEAELHFVNEDEERVFEPVKLSPFRFMANGPGRPLKGSFYVHIPNLAVPRLGDYFFRLIVDGTVRGQIPLYVILAVAIPSSDG